MNYEVITKTNITIKKISKTLKLVLGIALFSVVLWSCKNEVEPKIETIEVAETNAVKEMDLTIEEVNEELGLTVTVNYFTLPDEPYAGLVRRVTIKNLKKKKLNIQLYEKGKEIFIEVEDFGIGIPKEKLELIFEKFYRVNSNENETASGTGLGLTVTKDIVEEQHGKLLVESTLGKGSKFTIVLKPA